MKKILSFFFLLGIVSVLLVSCYKGNNVPSPSEVFNHVPKAPIQILMTDTPGPYTAVNIDLLQVRARVQDSIWYDLTTNQGIYNLLDFQNGIDTAIVNDSLPVLAIIDEIRLILGPNNTVEKDSAIYPLVTPSAQQSGIKIKLVQPIYQDSLNTIKFDFDANKSVKVNGNNKYRLHPVIKIL
ncbi:MAG: DUF4382 domain-containing protein [Chitinophagales bacterium]|nr:DUF4382 domain-containing protein [Chitinophagales bacterium]